jgi:hypothetical protein
MACGEVVAAVEHQIDLPHEHGQGVRVETLRERFHHHAGIQRTDRRRRGKRLVPADAGFVVQGLARQIRDLDKIGIGEQQPADAARGQIHRRRRTQPSQTNHQSLRRAQSLLPVDIDERHEDVAAVAQQIGVIHRAAPRPWALHPQAPASRP